MFNIKESIKSFSKNQEFKDKVKSVVKDQVNEQISFAKNTVKWYSYGIMTIIGLVILIFGTILFKIIF